MLVKQKHPKIMIVDDSRSHYRILSEKLRHQPYSVVGYTNAYHALQAIVEDPPDLILLDVIMPEMSGFEFCKAIKKEPKLKEIPVIFCSALEDVQEKAKAFAVGGTDYLTKPLIIDELKLRINNQLRLQSTHAALIKLNNALTDQLKEIKQDITNLQEANVISLVELARSRDNDTGYHLERTQLYCKIFAGKLSDYDQFKAQIGDAFITNIYHAAALHDIGKVAIPDNILLKTGRLSNEEFEIIKSHSRIGAQILKISANKYPRNEYLNMGVDIALYHHEKWDGSGYPEKLAGNEIPLSAHIMSFADVYDALRSKRSYKEAYPHDRVIELMVAGAGKQFNPQMTEIFIDIAHLFDEIFGDLTDLKLLRKRSKS